MPANGGVPAADLVIDFGLPEWRAHLGGGFIEGGKSGDISWSWLSDKHGWCVLPRLAPDRDYRLQLQAAPLAPHQAELRELAVSDGNQLFFRRVVVANDPLVSATFDCPAGRKSLIWRVLPLPQITVSLNEHVIAKLEYEQRPDLQFRECLLRRELRKQDTDVVYFAPNFAVSPEDLGVPGDPRQLSFRFYRMTLSALP